MRMSVMMYACCNEKTTLKRYKASQTITNNHKPSAYQTNVVTLHKILGMHRNSINGGWGIVACKFVCRMRMKKASRTKNSRGFYLLSVLCNLKNYISHCSRVPSNSSNVWHFDFSCTSLIWLCTASS